MHFLTLVTVEVPRTIENEIENQQVKQDITNIRKVLEEYNEKDGIFGKVTLKCHLRRLQGLQNTFARKVNDAVDEYLEPYSVGTQNPKYIEFYDTMEELKDEYETWNVTAVKLPNGKIVSERSDTFNDKYIIKDGKVFERYWGQLKTYKRTKRTQRMQVVKDYPLNKIYKTFETFLKAECQDSYNEEKKSYGYFCNPMAYYDWYVIGGRWAKCFLVKETCTEYSIGDRDIEKDVEAPKGYKWVVAARKKDIEWKVLADWRVQCETNYFKQFEEWFKTGVVTDDDYKLTEQGIECFGRLEYYKGETLENFLKRNCMSKEGKYAIEPYAYFKGEEWYESPHSSWSSRKDDVYDNEWQKELIKFIDELSDETVLVCVDCHM